MRRGPTRHRRALRVLASAALLPVAALVTVALATAGPAAAASSHPSYIPPTQTNVNPLQYPCTVTSPTCNSVGTTNGFDGGATVSFLYTQRYFCDTAESSGAPSGCEAGAKYANLPPGVPSVTDTDPLYIPVPLFTPSAGTTLGLQCLPTKPCIDHPHTIDLSRIASALPGHPSPTSVKDAMLPGHDHIVATANNNQPEWWPVVVVPVTSQAGWNALTGPTGRSYTKMRQLQSTASSGVGATVTTNVFLFFQVLPGTVAQSQQATSLSVPPSATNADGTTFTNLKTTCTTTAPGGCEDVGLSHDWINGKNVDALYTQEYFCDTSVSSGASTGCEAGATYNNLPPGVPSVTFTDPLYIPVPLFTPGPAYLQCPPGTPAPGGVTCIDHPNSIDLSRLASALGKPAATLMNVGLPGHDHIITTRNTTKPEWWPVVVVGVTNPLSFHEIEQAKSLTEVRTLQATPNGGVTADIPTNAFLWFQTLPGTGPVTPPVTASTSGCSSTLSAGTVVATAATSDGGGYWAVSSSGAVAAFGDAHCYGSLSGVALNKPIVGMAADPDTGGYWLVASDGGVFAFNAPFLGSMGSQPLNKPVVGMAASAATGGYWLVASDGGIFSFDAPFHGSMGALPLNQPVLGMSEDTATGGYWEVAADGGIFSFDAPFYGSMGGHALNKPVTGMAATATGGGYRLVASDGGIFDFGAAPFYGSMGGKVLNEPMVSMATDPATHGYWTVASDGGVFSFNAPFYGSAAS